MRSKSSARMIGSQHPGLSGVNVACVTWESWTKKDDFAATVDYVKEQTPQSQFNGYSLRRSRYSFDSTSQEGNRMTIRSLKTQPPEDAGISSVSQAELRNSNARFAPRRGDADDRIVISRPPGACESCIKMSYHDSCDFSWSRMNPRFRAS